MQLQSEEVKSRRSVLHRRYVRTIETAGRALGDGLYPQEPENCRRRLGAFLPNLANLALLIVVFQVYKLESPTFRSVAILTLAALPIHYLAPYRWKKPITVIVSILGMVWLFGPSQSLWVLLLASVLVGVSAAPYPWRVRVAFLAALASRLLYSDRGRVSGPRGLPPGSSRCLRHFLCSA